MKRILSILLLAIIVSALAFSAAASTGTVTKELSYSEIKITLDGEELIPSECRLGWHDKNRASHHAGKRTSNLHHPHREALS